MSATAAIGTQTTTTGTAGGKLGAIAGLAFAFLFFMGTAMLNIPHGTSDAKLVAWWADSGNQTTAVVSMYFFAVGGLVFLLAGYIPAKGESVTHPSGWKLEAIDSDPRRIIRVRLHAPVSCLRAASL